MSYKIITNGHRRPLVYWHELSPAEKAIASDNICYTPDDEDTELFRYRGWWYSMADITRVDIPGWDGAAATGFIWTAVVIRLVDGDGDSCGVDYGDYVVVGYYISD